jgi:mRNA interferase RelE/StbE
MLLLERNPEAGEPLVGNLVGFRKLTVGDRDWRIVWRVTHEASGRVVVNIAEVWAAGARADAKVYAEMTARIASLPAGPTTEALSDFVERLAIVGIVARPEPASPAELPSWLSRNLRDLVGLTTETIDGLTLEEAIETWNAWTVRPS